MLNTLIKWVAMFNFFHVVVIEVVVLITPDFELTFSILMNSDLNLQCILTYECKCYLDKFKNNLNVHVVLDATLLLVNNTLLAV